MPTFSLDRSPRPNQRQYSPERAMRMGGLAAAGSLLGATGLVAIGGGGSSADGATGTADTAGAGSTVAYTTIASLGGAAVADTTTVAPTTTITATTTTALVCTNTYTVLSGDYWLLIAQEASISVDELYAANNATSATAIFPGQSICLPDGTTVVVTTTPATVATTAATTPATTPATTVKTVTTAAPATPTTTPASSSHSS